MVNFGRARDGFDLISQAILGAFRSKKGAVCVYYDGSVSKREP